MADKKVVSIPSSRKRDETSFSLAPSTRRMAHSFLCSAKEEALEIARTNDRVRAMSKEKRTKAASNPSASMEKLFPER